MITTKPPLGPVADQLNNEQHSSPVGASLLAIAVCQSTEMLNVMQLSRASSLPQGAWVYSWITSAPLGMSNLNLDAAIGSLALTPVNRILVR
ncbi:hypothetical protein FHJ31_21810 [Pseudomonas sp. Fig-3]|nr:hypothetical protein FHJ31_21810 [Pseudomonas sp. Fig-3]